MASCNGGRAARQAWNQADLSSRGCGCLHFRIVRANCILHRGIGERRPHREPRRTDMTVSTERAVLAGVAIWGVQDLSRRYPGVISTRVDYTGGEVINATYRNHGNH